VYCNSQSPGARYVRGSASNATGDANVPLSFADCVPVGAAAALPNKAHPMPPRESSALLAAKEKRRQLQAQSASKATAPARPAFEPRIVVIEGSDARSEPPPELPPIENLHDYKPPQYFTTSNALDRVDVPWELVEVLRAGVGDAPLDDLAAQEKLDRFMRGHNMPPFGVDESKHFRHHDYSAEIDSSKLPPMSCVLYTPHERGQHEGLAGSGASDQQALPSGMRLHQRGAWQILRALATGMRSDCEPRMLEFLAKSASGSYRPADEAYTGFENPRGKDVSFDATLVPKGVLIAHSTGSGKTAVSVSAMQAFWFQVDRPLLYVCSKMAVATAIGKRAASDDDVCGGGTGRSEYARLAAMLFPTTLGNDDVAYDPALDVGKRAESKCVQTYLGNPANVSSRLKALTYEQLAEFIDASAEAPVDAMCTTPTELPKGATARGGVSTTKAVPHFGKGNEKQANNAVMIIDEAHNLLSNDVPGTQRIREFLSSPASDGVTLVLLTATPGDSVQQIETLCSLLRRSNQPPEGFVPLVSFFDSSGNIVDYPELQMKEPHRVPMTETQAAQVFHAQTDFDRSLASTLPQDAAQLLPQGLEPLKGGAPELRTTQAAEAPKPRGARRGKRAAAADAALPAVGEARDDEAEEQAGDGLAAARYEQDEARFERDTRESEAQLAELMASVNPVMQQQQQQRHSEDSEERKAVLRATRVFDAEVFTKQFPLMAPKLERVAQELSKRDEEGRVMKTFVYSRHAQATQGLGLLAEHKHGWRQVQYGTLAKLNEFLRRGADMAATDAEVAALETQLTSGSVDSQRDAVKALLDQVTATLAELAQAKSRDDNPLRGLNEGTPRSVQALREMLVLAQVELASLKKQPNDEDRFAILEQTAAKVISAYESAKHMQALLRTVEDGDVAARISEILGGNDVPLTHAAVSDANPKQGVKGRRFVVLDGANNRVVTSVFNHFLNRDGELIAAVLATNLGLESLDLKTTRRVLAVEPLESAVKTKQLMGRARRYCSHAELPPSQRSVHFETFVSDIAPEMVERLRQEVAQHRQLQARLNEERRHIYASAEVEVQQQEPTMRAQIALTEEARAQAVAHIGDVFERIKALRSRRDEARAVGSESHAAVIQLAGELARARSAEYPAAVRRLNDATQAVFKARKAYRNFQETSGSARVQREVSARLVRLMDEVEALERSWRERFNQAITERLELRTVEEQTMARVQHEELEIQHALGSLRAQSVDCKLLLQAHKNMGLQPNSVW